jgi:RNA polymerase-binding transcription factor DksA
MSSPIPSPTRTPAFRTASPLTVEQRAQLRVRLEQERQKLLELYGDNLVRQAEVRLEEGEDLVDHAAESWERELIFGEEEAARRQLLLVEEALARLDAGTYGLCFYAGTPIPYERLHEVPWTRYGVEAQTLLERGLIDERRPAGWPANAS